MANLKLQKRLAANILKVGQSRVWLDPSKQSEIKNAITKRDIRNLIKKGYIKKVLPKLKMPKGKRKRRGEGSLKGKKYSRLSKKRRWILLIRSLRKYLKELKEEGKIDNKTYRYLRRLAKGGMFRSRAHVKLFIDQKGLWKNEEKL